MSAAQLAFQGIAALVMATLVDRGLLNYNDLVVKYWPEFGAHGKSNITVKMLIGHEVSMRLLEAAIAVIASFCDGYFVGWSSFIGRTDNNGFGEKLEADEQAFRGSSAELATWDRCWLSCAYLRLAMRSTYPTHRPETTGCWIVLQRRDCRPFW